MTQDGFDFEAAGKRRKLAQLLRDLGIDRAAEHADAEVPEWSTMALGCLHAFMRNEYVGPFTAEEVRQYAEELGLEPPPDKRAWGGVFQGASRRREILATGEFTVANDPKVHCSISRLWKPANAADRNTHELVREINQITDSMSKAPKACRHGTPPDRFCNDCFRASEGMDGHDR